MLDIIIPAYNDTEGLRRTLNSIYFNEFNWITITVVDDASQEDYTEIKKEFPLAHFFRMDGNRGPGAARNFARKHSSEPYILFIDCGDIIFSKWCLYEIYDIITNNPGYYIYQWGWIDDELQKVRWDTHHSTPGKVYLRSFLEEHNLWQCEGKGSYGGEDLSMNTACVAILKELEEKTGKNYIKTMLTPIYSTITNWNSLTHKNNKEFAYKQVPSFIENIMHCMKLCEENDINIKAKLEIINNLTAILYHQFLLGLTKDKEYVKSYWYLLHKFYIDCYSKYAKSLYNEAVLSTASDQHMKGYLYVNKTKYSPNIRRFLNEIKNYEILPARYLDD